MNAEEKKCPVEVSGTNQILAHARDHSLTENLEYTAAWNAAALQTNDIPESLRAAKARETPKFVALSPRYRWEVRQERRRGVPFHHYLSFAVSVP
ncbi:hypothetical protein B0H14DRAFT_3501278 [Mycena olivaceomarginata]|nr:hypothetical protein B0H14DRAFT_3501278 [Mycena olivaceomarginata]